MKRKQQLFKTLGAAMFAAAMLLSSSAFAQVKIGTNPTVIDPANNLEVEASTTGNKVSINKTTGQVTIADGSQANERILTSDANGVATWMPKSSLRVEETVFIGEQSGDYTVTASPSFNVLKDRIPLNARGGSLPGYDATTKQYTIQESGYYRVFTGAFLTGTLPPPQITNVGLYLAPWNVLNSFQNINNSVGPVLSSFWQAYLNAGDKVNVYVSVNNNSGPAQSIIVRNGFLSVVKMF